MTEQAPESEEDFVPLGSYVKLKRLDDKLTLEQAAKAAGVNLTSLWKVEHMQRVGLKMWMRLAIWSGMVPKEGNEEYDGISDSESARGVQLHRRPRRSGRAAKKSRKRSGTGRRTMGAQSSSGG